MSAATGSEPGLLDYYKEAFFARSKVSFLGEVPLNVLFVLGIGILGVAMPGLALIGAGVELGFLSYLAQNPRFQNLIRGKRLAERAASFDDRLRNITLRLPPPARLRWETLRGKCESLREMSAAFQPKGASQAGLMQASGLSSLLLIHANLLQSRVALEQHASVKNADEIASKLADAQKRLAAADGDAIKRSLAANVEILRKREEHQQNARKSIGLIDSELDRIENQVDLIREEGIGARDPDVLSARIDAVTATVGDVNKVLADSRDLLGDLEGPTGSEVAAGRERVSEGDRS